jgi:hypothetical protein
LELTNTGADGPYRIVTAINRTTDTNGNDSAKLFMSVRRDVVLSLLQKRGITRPKETQIQQATAEVRLRVERAYKDVQLLFETYTQLYDGAGKPKDKTQTAAILEQAKAKGKSQSAVYTEKNIPRLHEPISATTVDNARTRLYTIFTSGWRKGRNKKKE